MLAKVKLMENIAYYDEGSNTILDIYPPSTDPELKAKIIELWSQLIPREIMKVLTMEGNTTPSRVKEKIGHSSSTIHENINKLQDAGLIETQMSYAGNKQRIITPSVIFVSRNPTVRRAVNKFLSKGFWIDTKKSDQIISFLSNKAGEYFTPQEISAATKIPVDEIESLLEHWESPLTRAFSDLFKEVPFEKKVLYRARK